MSSNERKRQKSEDDDTFRLFSWKEVKSEPKSPEPTDPDYREPDRRSDPQVIGSDQAVDRAHTSQTNGITSNEVKMKADRVRSRPRVRSRSQERPPHILDLDTSSVSQLLEADRQRRHAETASGTHSTEKTVADENTNEKAAEQIGERGRSKSRELLPEKLISRGKSKEREHTKERERSKEIKRSKERERSKERGRSKGRKVCHPENCSEKRRRSEEKQSIARENCEIRRKSVEKPTADVFLLTEKCHAAEPPSDFFSGASITPFRVGNRSPRFFEEQGGEDPIPSLRMREVSPLRTRGLRGSETRTVDFSESTSFTQELVPAPSTSRRLSLVRQTSEVRHHQPRLTVSSTRAEELEKVLALKSIPISFVKSTVPWGGIAICILSLALFVYTILVYSST